MSGVSIENIALGISGEHIRGINTQGAIAIGGSQPSNVQTQNEITSSDVKKGFRPCKGNIASNG